MHRWPCLSRKLGGAARFYGRVSKYPKCTVEPVFHGDWNERPDFTANHLSTQNYTAGPIVHENWRERPDFTAGHLKYPKMHCWPCLSWRLEGTAPFYGKSSKYPKLHCWPYRSWKLQGTARFYGKASKCPKMQCWAYLSCKMKETTWFKCKMGSKCPKCIVGPIFRAGGNSPMLRQRGSASLLSVYRKITWKIKRAHWLIIH